MIYKKIAALICCIVIALVSLTGCIGNGNSAGGGFTPPSGENNSDSNASSDGSEIIPDDTDEIPDADTEHDFSFVSGENGVFSYTCADCGKQATFTVEYVSGTQDAYSVDGNVLTFTTVTEDSEYSLVGEFYGNIVIDTGNDYKFALTLNGFTVTSENDCPIKVLSGDKFTLSAKKSTENYVYDVRETVAEDEISAAIYAVCDTNLQGKGTLCVKSANNNGIHTKDDLKVKNLTLKVECTDNALKGNDSVTIESGTITLIATNGDGIKTSNSDVSSKGNQRGIVTISGGEITIYASRDGIDAAYDVIIDESSATLTLKIYTDKYSEFSAESAGSSVSSNTSGSGTFGGGFGNRPGGNGNMNGNPGGDGNTQKGDYSTKGIKSDDAITISAGTIVIKSYDDCIHANNDETLENGETATGNVTIAGGSLTLFSCDDAIHADGKASVEGGNVNVVGCYEGIEGSSVEISGGDVSVVSSDDGLNGTGTTGASIVVSGGTLYVYAGGDGVDSNSTTSYGGIIFSGGKSVIISVGQADSAIDTEQGYSFTGGFVLAVGKSGGMSGETTNCKQFSSVGKSSNLNLSSGSYLIVDGIVEVKLPATINAAVVTLGANGASVSAKSSSDSAFAENGVCWL